MEPETLCEVIMIEFTYKFTLGQPLKRSFSYIEANACVGNFLFPFIADSTLTSTTPLSVETTTNVTGKA